MVVVLDSEYVYKGITEWSPKWHRHSRRVKSRDVGHQDLWEAIFQVRHEAGSLLKFIWTPSHMWVGGNDKAGALAQFGREMQPNDKKRKGDADRVPHLWRDAGFSPMCTDVSSSESSGDNSSVVSSRARAGGELHPHTDLLGTSSSSGGSSEEGSSDSEGSGFSADVSERQRERKRQRRAGGKWQDGTTIDKIVW